MVLQRTDNCRIMPLFQTGLMIMKTWPGIGFVKRLAKRPFEDHQTDRRMLWRCALAAVLLILCVFPDVIFLRASLSNASLVNVTLDDGHKKVQLFPEREGRQPYEGFYDAGGGAFQSEPGAQFVRRSLQAGQSIYWNPYSATGSYGPETLVDIKTSPVSILNAILNGGQLTSHIVFLGFNLLAVFCLLVLFTIEFRLSFVAAVAGGVTYLLNGYYVANLGSNVAQVWLYFPVLTLALVSFARRPNTMKLVGITCSAVLVLATTFLPTMILTLATALLVGAAACVGHSLAQERGLRSTSSAAARLIAGQLAGVSLALLTLAILYLPTSEALKYMATGDYYAARQFYPAHLFNLISLFTPKHAFEAYNAITPRADLMRGNVAFHQGIIGALLATQVVRPWPILQRTVIVVVFSVLLVLLGRIYGLPGLTPVVDLLPVLGNLGEQYLWVSLGLLFTIAVAFGLHGLLVGGLRLVPLLAGATVIGSALAYTTFQYGLENVIFVRYVWITGSLLALGAVLVALRKTSLAAPTVIATSLVVLSWGELTFYVDHYRLARYDRFSNPAPFVRFLQTHSGLHRIANYGPSGVPPEYGSAFGLYQIGSMNFQLFPRYVDIFNRLILPDPKDRWTGFITMVRAPDVDSLNLRAFDFLGVKYLVTPSSYPRLHQFMERSGWRSAYSDPAFVIYENPDPLPRAFIVHQVSEGHETPLDIGKSPLAVATSDDPVLIEEARSRGLLDANPRRPGNTEQAEITRYDHTRVAISANVTQAGLLVLNDVWHPNWKVQVDGVEQHLGEVNEAFRGVLLAPGKHVVEMSYAPRTFAMARVLSIVGLATMLLLVLFRRRIDRRLTALIGRPQARPSRLHAARAGR
jgi:Bacterial membrane protein YfhO